jgi:iron complex outermembrane recepter protein
VGARYTTRVADRKTVMRLNVNNLLDNHYWSGSFAEPRATLAQGRTVEASVTVDF